MAEDAKVSGALQKAILMWHGWGWTFRKIWSRESYYESMRLYGPFFLYIKHLQVAGPCYPKLPLSSSVYWQVSWQVQNVKACASLCAKADVCELLLIHLQDVPPVCDNGLESGFMRKRECMVQTDFFIHSLGFLFLSFSIVFT